MQLKVKQEMNKFSAGILLMVVYCFIRINELGNASVLVLFDAKKKEPFGGGRPVPIFHR
jgi:hypothetical protein